MIRVAFAKLRAEGSSLGRELISPWRSHHGLSQEVAGAEHANGIAREQFRQLMRKSRGNLLASVLGLLLWTIALLNLGAGWEVGLWVAAMLACLARISYLSETFVRRAPSDAELRCWEARLGQVVSVMAVGWASIASVYPLTEAWGVPYMTIGLVLVVAGTLALFANYRPSTAWFSLPLGVVVCAILVAGHRGLPQVIGVGFLMATVALTYMARAQNALISRNMMIAAERLDLIRDVERSREEAACAHRAKTRAFASVAHDLRQPMHSISLLTGRLAAHSEYRTDARSHIDASVQAMGRLLKALNEASAVSVESHAGQVCTVALDEVFDRLRQQFEPQARARGIEYRMVPCGLTVRTDAFRLERILCNLMSNAIRCTDGGCVTVRARARADRAVVQVWDSGPGIARQYRERIFDEFYQVPRAGYASGLGLGLATVRQLTHRLGHRIQVRSRVGTCSMFSVEVPLGRAGTVSTAALQE